MNSFNDNFSKYSDTNVQSSRQNDIDADSYEDIKIAIEDFLTRFKPSPNLEQEKYLEKNPWAGLAPYEDPKLSVRDLKFCGRDDEIYDVIRLIAGNQFVTLYGKSGIGKTSLLNAGVFPELREANYTPINLRLGIRNENDSTSYQKIIIETLKLKVFKIEKINVIEEQTDTQAIDYLWNYFACHRFYDERDEPTIPVVVFDQFEEVFRFNNREADSLLRQLDYITDKDHKLDNCFINGVPYQYSQNFRFVVSIREDNLYYLEDSIDNCYLPALKRCRYRLHSLSLQGAKDVILVPGKNLFEEREKAEISSIIIKFAQNESSGSIDTNILSMLCHRLYVEHVKRGKEHLGKKSVIQFVSENPFEKLFKEATAKLSRKEKIYIVNNLIDSNGNRNSLSEADLSLNVRKYTSLIEGDNKILQRIPFTLDSKTSRIELLHDSFCEPIIKIREKYCRQNDFRSFFRSCGCLTILLLFFILNLFLFLYTIKERQQHTESVNHFNIHEEVNISEPILGYANSKDVYQKELQHLTINAICHFQFEDAERFAQLAIDIDTSNVSNHVRLLEVLLFQNKTKEVANYYALYGNRIMLPLLYDVSQLIQLGLIDYRQLINNDSIVDAFDYSVTHDHDGYYKKELGRLSFYAICLGKYKEAEQHAIKGIQLDSSQLYNYARLTESLILQGRVSESLNICNRYKSELGDFITSDLEYLLKKGVVPPNRISSVQQLIDSLRTENREYIE